MSSSSKKKKVSKSGPPRRRGPRGWVSDAMCTHLVAEIPAFRTAQAAGRLNEFWPAMHTRLAVVFPTAPLTDEEIAKGMRMEDKIHAELLKLKTWFNNNGRIGSKQGKPLLDLQLKPKKPKKKLSMVQAYTKKYFETKIKPIAIARYQEHLREAEAGLVDLMQPLHHRNRVIREFWNLEPQEVIDEIAAYRERRFLNGGSSDEDDDQEDNEDSGDDEFSDNENNGQAASANTHKKRKANAQLASNEAKAREYNDNQSASQAALLPILSELHERTGYVGALVLAAPDGTRGGELSTVSLFIGKTPQRLDWGQHYTEDAWRENVEGPLIEFASLVYPPEARDPFRLGAVSVHMSATGEETRMQYLSSSLASSRSLSRAPSATTARAAARKNDNEGSNSGKEGCQGKSDTKESEDEDEGGDEDDASDENEEIEPMPWEDDKELTALQRASIEAEKGHYYKMKAYNIIRNKRCFEAMQLPELAKAVVSDSRAGTLVTKIQSPLVAPESRESSNALSSRSPPWATEPLHPLSPAESQKPTLSHQAQAEHIDPATPTRGSSPVLGSPRLLSSSGSPFAPGAQSPQLPSSPVMHSRPSTPKPLPSLPNSQRHESPANPLPHERAVTDRSTLDHHPSLATLGPSLADTHPTNGRWPGWMKESVRAMEQFGPSVGGLKDALESWVQFEDLMGYPDSKAKKNVLSSQNRPQDIHAWIKKHRKVKEMPDVSVYVDRFGEEWRAWWASLQPERDTDGNEARDIAEYSELQKAGPNGLYLLMLSLVWWGSATLCQSAEQTSLWRQSVQEFTDMVNFFNTSMNGAVGSKRPRDAPEAKSSSRTAKRPQISILCKNGMPQNLRSVNQKVRVGHFSSEKGRAGGSGSRRKREQAGPGARDRMWRGREVPWASECGAGREKVCGGGREVPWASGCGGDGK
ncbi:hypothetical protein HWV62_5682, partial [Athelia sp. TMB]